jgi:hypothetical protein
MKNYFYDPKLGYHWVWLYPLAFLFLILTALAFPFIKLYDFYQEYQHRKHMQKIYKNNPKIKELSDLAGIKNENLQ